jgi:hypothetical protein
MARRFEEFYQIKKGDNLGDPEFWNRKLEDLDLRLAARELDGAAIAAAVEQLISVGLSRINDTFTPVIDEAIDRLQSVGAAFSSTSDTEATIDTDPKTFALDPSTWASFVVTDYVAIRPADHADRGIVAQVTAYDRDTGLLDVSPVLIIGSGTYSDWLVRPTPAPDIEHATRTDNPHETTAEQVGAYTTTQVDAAILALKNQLLGGAGPAFDTLQELATALGSDAAFSTTVANALAARVRTDAVMALTQVQRDRVRASVIGSPLAALANRNLFPNPLFNVNQEYPAGVSMVSGGGYYTSDQFLGSWAGTAGTVYGGPLSFFTYPAYAKPGYVMGNTLWCTVPIAMGGAGANRAVSNIIPIDAWDFYALAYGTANARRLGYAFHYFAPRAATITVRACNGAVNRSFYADHAVAAGWNLIRGVIPGDTDPASAAGNAAGWGLQIVILHASNWTDKATANGAWQAGVKHATTGTSDNVNFTVAGDRVVIAGMVIVPDLDFTQFDATELDRALPEIALNLQDVNHRCDFYYQVNHTSHPAYGFGNSGNGGLGMVQLRRPMRHALATGIWGNPGSHALIQCSFGNFNTTSWTFTFGGLSSLTWQAAGGTISWSPGTFALIRFSFSGDGGFYASGRIM